MEIEQNEITTEAWLKHSSWGEHYTSGRKQWLWSIKKINWHTAIVHMYGMPYDFCPDTKRAAPSAWQTLLELISVPAQMFSRFILTWYIGVHSNCGSVYLSLSSSSQRLLPAGKAVVSHLCLSVTPTAVRVFHLQILRRQGSSGGYRCHWRWWRDLHVLGQHDAGQSLCQCCAQGCR